MREKIEELVRQVVVEYVNNERNEEQKRNKKLFVILEGNSMLSKDEIWEVISVLSKSYKISVCVTESPVQIPINSKHESIQVVDTSNMDIVRLRLEEANIVFVPAPSLSTLAKLALTIDDTEILKLLIGAQFAGKPIVVAKDSLIPKGDQKVTTPSSIQKKIHTYLKQLREDQVQVTTLKKVVKDNYFENFTEHRPIVLAKHIEEVAKEGFDEFQVPTNSIITPLGREYAKDLGISIKYKE
ncbi:hypothetical protein ACFSCX_08570 [Bacillus salitolerans]|uniref:Flavoprotein domain-containing protein n=1 Tax=Bacillus salitolerans TaxID=1437434 RepID=A0ABW4LRB8_9BACI